MSSTPIPAEYVDVEQLLAGGMLEAPAPTIGMRSDGHQLIYAAAVNIILGPAENGKTLAASAIAADTLFAGDSVLMIDLDYNGANATITRMRQFGVSAEVLSNPTRFRLAMPDTAEAMNAIVTDAATWQPTLTIVDSMGELLPMYGANSNDADDYTRVHRSTLAAIASTGSAVLAIDHEAKGVDSRNFGATGTAAKKRAVDGVMLRCALIEPFIPGRGGKASLAILKDRHGNLRSACPTDQREPLAAVFQLITIGNATDWKFHAPTDQPHSATLADTDKLAELSPPPASVRDIKARMKWST
ncbi:MAG: hypothetical protein JWQ47_831, partial [Glaciihabitans sp.]|nr:hypothetical protein [Glaciihabitans sp.]